MMMSLSAAGSRKCLLGLSLTRTRLAALEPLGDVVRGDAFAGAAVAVVAHGRNQQMRLVADFAARRGDRIGARRQRPRQRAQLVGGRARSGNGDQVDELAAGDPVVRLRRRRSAP